MAKNWWEDPEQTKDIPKEALEQIQAAAEAGHVFDSDDVTPGDTGTPSSN